MKFSRFAKYLLELESTTKRLEITEILSRLIKEFSQEETEKGVYLSLGQLGPLFDRVDFAIADKMMLRVFSKSYGEDEATIKKLFDDLGDLGKIANELAGKHKTKDAGLTVLEVYDSLLKIAKLAGQGSQEKKVADFASLLQKLDKLSAKFIVRIPVGNTRLGFSDVTVIEALSWMAKGDKSLKSAIENYFHRYPDIGKVASLFKKGGLKALEQVGLEVGVPVLPQLCQRVGTFEEAIEKLGGKAGSEFKFDGTRVQLHMDKGRMISPSESQLTFFESNKEVPFVKTFTRNLEETTHMFPDIVRSAIDSIDAKSVIVDGEAVGIDPKTGNMLPFQETSQRKRKNQILEKISEIPLKYFVFDILYLNGKELLDKPFSERREILKSVIKTTDKILVDDQKLITNSSELSAEFKKAKDNGLEGVVVKKLTSPYEAGGRGFSWIKIKREETGGLEDTIDAVILGYYFGKGARTKFGIGGFLVGTFDKEKDHFVTLSKVGSGPTEAEWELIKKKVDAIKVKEKPANYEVSKTLLCDVWAKPEIVVVIRADEITVSDAHTAGFALRFPRLMDFRADKDPRDTTSVDEVKHLYELQGKKV